MDVEVGAGGGLDWWPTPLVVSPGARHRSSTTLRADLEGRPLLGRARHHVPGWAGPAVLGGGRYVGSAAVLGPEPPSCLPPPWAAPAGPGALARVVAADLAGRDALARAAAQGRGALGLMER